MVVGVASVASTWKHLPIRLQPLKNLKNLSKPAPDAQSARRGVTLVAFVALGWACVRSKLTTQDPTPGKNL